MAVSSLGRFGLIRYNLFLVSQKKLVRLLVEISTNIPNAKENASSPKSPTSLQTVYKIITTIRVLIITVHENQKNRNVVLNTFDHTKKIKIMKKIQTTILICFLAFTTLMVGCKKDEATVSNTEAKTLLTKKWFYYTIIEKTTSTGAVKFENNITVINTLEFKADNTVVDSYYEITGTFTLSADGKTASMSFPAKGSKAAILIDFNITTLTSNSLEFNFIDGQTTTFNKLGSTPPK